MLIIVGLNSPGKSGKRKEENNMKTLLFLCFIVFLPITAHADEVTDWTITDTIMQVVVTGLLEVDREQTLWISKNPFEITGTKVYTVKDNLFIGNTYRPHKESNPIIGYRAHPDRINIYFATAAVGHAAISFALPYIVKACGGSDKVAKYSRTIWQGTWITAEMHTIGKNIFMGVGMSF